MHWYDEERLGVPLKPLLIGGTAIALGLVIWVAVVATLILYRP